VKPANEMVRRLIHLTKQLELSVAESVVYENMPSLVFMFGMPFRHWSIHLD
jgi:hypothetical protein